MNRSLTRRCEQSDAMRIALVDAVLSLRPGEVVSYGDVAARAGYPNRHRAVGQLLSIAADSLPWWRVVYASGDLPPVNPSLQEQRLREEGVRLKGFRVIASPLGRWTDEPAADAPAGSSP